MSFLLLIPFIVLPQSTLDHEMIYRKKTLALVESYIPEYSDLLSQHLYSPSEGIRYVNNKRVPNPTPTEDNGILLEFGTIVHESVHDYNGRSRILVVPGTAHLVDLPEIMHSREMSAWLKKDFGADSLFRFDSYVGSGSLTQRSNMHGIIGLLDEYSAYYHGCYASFETWKKGQATLDEEILKSLREDAMATYFACYEFEAFIGAYLSYTRQHEPEIYGKTIANEGLKSIYTALHGNFETLNNEIRTTFQKEHSLVYFEKKYTQPALRLRAHFEKELEKITGEE